MKKILIALLLAGSPAFAQVPNKLEVVKDVQRRNPVAWSCAHTVSACGHDFIKILACTLWKQDGRFGLNGKRGNPSDLSWDAINWKGEGPGHDPTNGGMPVTVIDVIGSAGSPAAYAAWTVFDTLPGPGAWVQPVCPDGTTPEPTPIPVPQPPAHMVPAYEALGGDAFFRSQIGVPLQSDMIEGGQGGLNDGSSVWFSRATYDILAAYMRGGAVDSATIVKAHRNVWRGILGLPAIQ